MAEEKKIQVVELFAGVGGFRVGLEAASPRFETVWADQWEPGQAGQWAYQCYEANFGRDGSGSRCVNQDIDAVTDQVPPHDLLVGGFPCQDYSVASTGAKGIQGKKGVLWWSIHEIVKLRKPKYILLENVDRLLKSPAKQRGRDLGIILRCLRDEGYVVEWRVINAADYGMAQRRRRTFIFAARRGTKLHRRMCRLDLPKDADAWIGRNGFFAPAFPVEGTVEAKQSHADLTGYEDLVAVTEQFAAAFYNAGIMVDGKVCSREVLPRAAAPTPLSALVERDGVEERFYIPEEQMDKWVYLKGAKSVPRRTRTGFEYTFTEGPIAFPDPLDRPARTMLTSEGTTNRSTHIIPDPLTGRKRRLTPLECERINGFPDGWTDTGMPERQRYFIMGNALVVPLIEKMGRRLLDIL